MINKIKLWIKSTGLSNVGWAGGALVALFLGWKLALGACLGIFVYLNFNAIRKLIKKG